MAIDLAVPDVHYVEIDGVPTYWAEAPGAIVFTLVFDGGICSEPVHLRGCNHLIEHLVLSEVGATPYEYNGFVDLRRTAFGARGKMADLASFVGTVTRGLAELPVGRHDLEPGVLAAEAQGRQPTTMTHLLAFLYGNAGPGLIDHPEWALRHVTGEALEAWTAEFFHRGRAAAWATGDPTSLDLSAIPEGDRPSRWTLPEQIDGPGWTGGNISGFGAVAVLPRSTVASTWSRVVPEQVRERLRTQAGVTYAVGATYEPITSKDVLIGLHVDASEERRLEVRDLLFEVLDEVAAGGCHESWLKLDAERLSRASEEPGYAVSRAMRAAQDHLFGAADPLDESWIDEYAALTPEDLADVTSTWLARASWMMPDTAPMPVGRRLPRLANFSDGPVAGRDLVPVQAVEYGLRAGAEGLSVVHGPDRVITVRFDRTVLVQRWDNGARVLHDEAGFRVAYVPDLWHETTAFVDWIDAATAGCPVIPMGVSPAD